LGPGIVCRSQQDEDGQYYGESLHNGPSDIIGLFQIELVK
jgi:hypothetical protein